MFSSRNLRLLFFAFHLVGFIMTVGAADVSADGKTDKYSYEDFEKPGACRACHLDIFRQWEQSMMSQAYTHHWDEVEYFKLAVAHGKADPDFETTHEGCNGCHTPMAYLSGDVPPPRPGESRADESVSCDICHTLTGFEGDIPFNFNWKIDPGSKKRGPRKADEAKNSPHHEMVFTDFVHTAEFCGTCHNEKDDFGMWVKSTHLEWKEGPYSKQGVICQDCHMTYSPGRSAMMGNEHPDVAQHLFHGAHDPGKVAGTIELRIHPDIREAEPGEPVKFTLALFNGKTGHKFPTGSVEDRIVWVHVEAKDAKGNVYHLPVDKKGFDGEDMTIAADVLAYQDMGPILGKSSFAGVQRDGVPVGDRIFRMPYLDPQGRMTIMQWNTKSFGPDYRIGPRETKLETYTFELPQDAEPGKMTVTATMYYALLVKPVAELLGAEEEAIPMVVNIHSTTIEVLD
ncbi:MAG: multiheme c-type cytochrome [Candidatus Electryonea clarkiae]|nr:multiheme c-type cytochrome [Candidatus Electryonea clarkiae]MDP8285121.1 multiheme c-type cytochrome [Candidatus Electryonea clarkiae]